METGPPTIDTILCEAVEIESAAEREAFLDEACGEDAELRHRVEKLIADHFLAGDFLEDPPVALTASIDQPVAERPGQTIGRYKLLQEIGEGGFGVVYMAEQQETVRRKVALKIIKLGMDTKQVIARFEAERQALAMMAHPNIAKVFDAGATDSGRPYFVMELIRGIAITDYCDGNHLTTKERLKLFIDVCHAVQHAHQKGIIHRDVKPTNVMVTQQDGRPVPKVIDFGIAKATEHRLTEKTLYTTYRQLIGTPEYMSPEQATFCETDIDTRSDIYSLGVLLYELLVGTTPFDAEALRSRGYDEICRVIRESDPPTPSKRLSTMGEVVAEISKHRHVEPAALRKLLRGDVDWIVMKALEKDRRRRYETVHGLARDIERHLSDEPVRARPPSAGYRLKKFIRKHRVSVAATVAVLGMLVVGLALTALGFARAEQARRIATEERDRANENLGIARQIMIDVIEPAAIQMSGLPFTQDTEWEVLEKALGFYERILEQAADDPEPRREMVLICGHLGRLAWNTDRDGEPVLRRGIAILNDLAQKFPNDPGDRLQRARLHYWLGAVLREDLRFEEAIDALQSSIAIAEDCMAEFPTNDQYRRAFADANIIVGWYLVGAGKLDEAESHCRAAISTAAGLAAWPQVASRHTYATLLMHLARYDEAEHLLDEALQIAEQEMAPKASPPHEGWQNSTYRLAFCHRMRGKLFLYTGGFEAAEQHLCQSIERLAPWADGSRASPQLKYLFGLCHHDLAEVLTAMGLTDQAEPSRRTSLATLAPTDEAETAEIRYGRSLAHYRMGELLHHVGRTDEAAREFAAALAIMEQLSSRQPECLVSNWQLVCLLANCPDPALRDPPRAAALAQRMTLSADGPHWRYRALAQYRIGEWQAAANSIQRSTDLRQGGDAYDWLLLAMAHSQLGQKEESLESYTEAQEAIEANRPIFYEYLGVMAVDRLRSEAEMLLGKRTENVEEE